VVPGCHVVCVGSANLDHVLELDALPSGEGKQLARGSRWSGGGLAATAAVAVAALEGRATWCGLTGDDSNGRTLTRLLTEAGVEFCDEVVASGARTPVAAVLVDPLGRRWLGWDAGEGLESAAAAPHLPDFAAIDVVLADTWSVPLSAAAFRRALAHGLPRVLDWELADPSTARELAELADHVIFSAIGLSTFTGIGEVDASLRAAADRLPGTVIAVSLGPEGSAWLTEEGVVRVPAPHVRARDTTGCGDVFHGAYALGIGEGWPVQRAAIFATAAAALKAERGNGWSGMPDRSGTESLMTGIRWL
jgi:sulfofructose kinase